MAFDTLKSETQEEEFNRLGEAFHEENIEANSSGLEPLASDITDTCAVLLEQVQNFVKIHNGLKEDTPSVDAICDASYNFHKVAFMMYTCMDELNKTIDTSWYHENPFANAVFFAESCGKNEPKLVIE